MKQGLRRYWLALLLGLLAVLIAAAGDTLQLALRYDRQAIGEGEVWRLLTGHLVHLSSGHLLMNLLGMGLVVVFFWPLLGNGAWLVLILFSALFIALAIYLFHPQVLWYVGLSGIIHALFIAGGLADLRVRPWEGRLFLALVGFKLAWEQLFGPLPGSERSAGGPVLVDAHLYGALAGLAFWLLWRRWRRYRGVSY